MTQKIKISILVEVEYEPNADHYPPNSTILDMMALDLESATEDLYLTMDIEYAKWTITGDVITNV